MSLCKVRCSTRRASPAASPNDVRHHQHQSHSSRKHNRNKNNAAHMRYGISALHRLQSKNKYQRNFIQNKSGIIRRHQCRIFLRPSKSKMSKQQERFAQQHHQTLAPTLAELMHYWGRLSSLIIKSAMFAVFRNKNSRSHRNLSRQNREGQLKPL